MFVPSNTAPKVEFKVNPALIDAKPVCDTDGVNVSFDSIQTLITFLRCWWCPSHDGSETSELAFFT